MVQLHCLLCGLLCQSDGRALPHAALLGLDEYERQLKDAIRAAFEARAAAYTEEVRGDSLPPLQCRCTLHVFEVACSLQTDQGTMSVLPFHGSTHSLKQSPPALCRARRCGG